MTRRRCSLLCAMLPAALAATAGADVDVVVPNHARVTTTFANGAEIHTFRTQCPSGAKLAVRATSAKKGPSLEVTISDPIGSAVGSADGRKAAVRPVTTTVNGPYAIRVASADGTTTGTYALTVEWKSARSFKDTVSVTVGSEGEFTFGAEAGATASVALKAAKHSAAVPALAALVTPAGTVAPLGPGATAEFACDLSGDYVVRFDAGGLGGAVVVSLKVKPPKPATFPITIAPGAIPAGADVLASLSIGPDGGLVSVSEGPLSGSSVDVPAGAVAAPTSLLVGTGSPVPPKKADTTAGPPVFIGPEGLTFPPGHEPVVTVPYDPSQFPDGASQVELLTRDAEGQVTPIVGTTVDEAAHTVSAPVSHFSVFQVMRAFHLQETQRLEAPVPAAGGQFGTSVAFDGDVAAIGEPFAPAPGGVFVFRLTAGTWAEETLLPAPPSTFAPPGGSQFGASVSVAGNHVLVGAPFQTNPSFGNVQTGAAHMFVQFPMSSWAWEQVFLPASGHALDRFGTSVAVDPDTAIVGGPFTFNPLPLVPGVGAAYVYARASVESSNLEATLRSSSPPANGFFEFGRSVAISGDVVVVGAPGENSTAGAAYVFRRTGTTWSQAGRIQPADVVSGDRFGQSVAIDGTTIVVGCNDRGAAGPGHAPVRLFEDQGTAFPEVQRLESADATLPGESDRSDFGTALALRGNLLVVGAPAQSTLFPGATSPLAASGNAFVYRRLAGVWTFAARLRGSASDLFPLASGDSFGASVATDGSTILVGSPSDSQTATTAGAAYVFDASRN